MKSLKNKRAKLLMSAECNLNCSYCYINKNDSLSDIDDEILNEWKERGILNKLKANYGDIEHIGLWGSEPTLYLEHFLDELPDILDYYPRLSSILISSNFYAQSSIDKLFRMIKIINKEDDRNFNLELQTSLDGPPSITNKTRPPKNGEGNTVSHIKDNLDYLLSKLSSYEVRDALTIRSKFKSTVSKKYINMMGKDKDKLVDYIKFFDNEMGSIYERYSNDLPDSFEWSVTSGAPTMVVPDQYTVEDGKYLQMYIKNVKELAVENHEEGNISSRFKIYAALPSLSILREIDKQDKIFREQNRGFACSAGGKGISLAVGNESHVCHRDALLSHDDYMDLIENDNDEYQMGRLRQYRDNMIVDDKNDNKDEYLRQRYVIQGWRDYAQLRFSYNYANLKFMAKIGQANGRYVEDDDFAKLLSQFLLKTELCAVGNIKQTGSYFLKPMSITKLWANGAFETLIESYNELVEGGIIHG